MEEYLPVIPAHIIETILLKLPVKPLLRFKAVSKSWNTIISDPGFVDTHHLHQSRHARTQNLFVHKHSDAGCSLVEFKGGKFQTLENLDEPNHWNEILCFCKGMFLLGNHPTAYALWNPSMRTVIKFQYPFGHWYDQRYGICYDRRSDDFKVIFTSVEWYAIFSCKNKTWVEKKTPNSTRILSNSVVCVHDVVYWTMMLNCIVQVACYDPVEDGFFILDRPEGVERKYPVYIVELGGYLCVYCHWRDKKTIRIWKRDDTCWRWEEWMTFENVPVFIHGFRPLRLVGDKIVIILNQTKLVVYSPSAKTYEEFGDTSLSGVRLVPYVESLLCPW